VSALGHYLEEEGIATVAISLIRPQTEKTRPPRALWVPFALGRPFGPPSDPAFQRRVAAAALRLLELPSGPVVIADFPDDDPREQPDPAWRPPPLPALGQDLAPTALAAQLEAEIARLADSHRRWTSEHGRTSVGLTGLSAPELGQYVADWLRGRAPASPRAELSAALMLRFAADDLKAYCLEAGAAGPARPSAQQLGDWFWNQTAAGASLIALRGIGLASDNDRLKLIAGNFLVPGNRVPRTAPPATTTATSLEPWQPGH
jgi:hypothetical protein